MSELDDKLSAILGNPQMMQQIMSLAQSLGDSPPEKPRQSEQPPGGLKLDPGMLQAISRMSAGGTVDSDQQALLTALSPYLSQSRVSKLERAMRAARIAGAASAFLGSGALQRLTGR
ncbi:MAG: hypothetical protein Q4F17_05190 [Eubacteriales bacterium]|nr:hypothetical protein [Eubacteriales bacterium]